MEGGKEVEDTVLTEICVKCNRDLDPNEEAAYFFNIDGYVCEECLVKHGSTSQKRKWEMQSK